jgi:hypothetical protein
LLFDTFGLLISGKIEELELDKEKMALGWQGRSHCMLKTIIDFWSSNLDFIRDLFIFLQFLN